MYDRTPAVKGVTNASRTAWLPMLLGGGGVAAGVATGLTWLFAPLGLVAAGGAGVWLWRKHKRELVAQHEQSVEATALAVFRRHSGASMTKEQLVRDHRLHPDEADEVLNWLVTHELLVANWEDYEGPMVYERSDAAAGLPVPGAQAPPPGAAGRPVVVHPHHERPPSMRQGPFKNPAVAMLLSLWPGLGQMYCGRFSRGVAWLFATALAYSFGSAMTFAFGPGGMLPGMIMHILNVSDARATADRVNRHIQHFGVPPGAPRPMPTLTPPPRRPPPRGRPPYPPRR